MILHFRAALLSVFVVCCATLLPCTPAHAGADRSRVRIDSGSLVGTSQAGVREFLGIPFAAPPIGERRWRKPLPPAAWTGDRDATKFGAACPQPALVGAGRLPSERSEDCLYLNVWAPDKADRPLPVMVWIHGGAHRIGAASLPYYDGAALARRGVIVVSLNYRLGYLGYFAHPALEPESDGGNFGLMDQIAALQWVQRNIGKFGGDASRVTVFGESAGGASVLYLLTNGKAEGLFARAIVESGGGWQKPIARSAMEAKVVAGLAKVGVDAKVDAKALRALDPQKLIDAQSGEHELGFGPFLDGATVSAAPDSILREGREAAVPLIIGSNTWEGSLMATLGLGERGSGLAERPRVKDLYRNEAKTDGERSQALFRDLVFAAPAHWVATTHARRAPTYLYTFGYVRSAKRGSVAGVAHGGEVPYVFDTLGSLGGADISAADKAMAAQVADCWTAFAATGKPDCKLGAWSAYSSSLDNTFVIGNDGSAQQERYRATILDDMAKFFGPDRR